MATTLLASILTYVGLGSLALLGTAAVHHVVKKQEPVAVEFAHVAKSIEPDIKAVEPKVAPKPRVNSAKLGTVNALAAPSSIPDGISTDAQSNALALNPFEEGSVGSYGGTEQGTGTSTAPVVAVAPVVLERKPVLKADNFTVALPQYVIDSGIETFVCVVRVLVNKDGSVKQVWVLRTPELIPADVVADAVKQAGYQPARMSNGEQVEYTHVHRLTIKLRTT